MYEIIISYRDSYRDLSSNFHTLDFGSHQTCRKADTYSNLYPFSSRVASCNHGNSYLLVSMVLSVFQLPSCRSHKSRRMIFGFSRTFTSHHRSFDWSFALHSALYRQATSARPFRLEDYRFYDELNLWFSNLELWFLLLPECQWESFCL